MDERRFTEMKTLAEMQSKGLKKFLVERIRVSFINDWVFCGYERWIVLSCFLWTVYSIGRFLIGLI